MYAAYSPSQPASLRLSTPLPRPATPAPRAGAVASPYASQAARYRDAELASATPGQLIVMLFDKMLLTLRRAKIACEAKRIEERCEAILLATDMVTELRVSLDHEQGGAISAQLDALYGYMLRELFEANRLQDAAKLDVVTRMATELRDAFAQITGGAAAGTSLATRSA